MPATNSENQPVHRAGDAENPARIQPWFATMATSLLPALVSFYLPEAFRVPLFVATGVLYAVACAMLYRQTKNGSGSHDR